MEAVSNEYETLPRARAVEETFWYFRYAPGGNFRGNNRFRNDSVDISRISRYAQRGPVSLPRTISITSIASVSKGGES